MPGPVAVKIMLSRGSLGRINEEGSPESKYPTIVLDEDELQRKLSNVVGTSRRTARRASLFEAPDLELRKLQKTANTLVTIVHTDTPRNASDYEFSASATRTPITSRRESLVNFNLTPASSVYNLAMGKETKEARDENQNAIVRKTTSKPTYQLSPGRIFNADQVRSIVMDIFKEQLQDCNNYSGVLCKRLTDLIKLRVKRLCFDRYRIIAYVLLGSKQSQSMRFASRFVWDERFDNYADVKYENANVYAVGIVYGVYKE